MLLHLFAENSMQNSCNYLGKMSNAENSAYLQVLTGLFPFLTRKENRSLYVWKTFENKIILTLVYDVRTEVLKRSLLMFIFRIKIKN